MSASKILIVDDGPRTCATFRTALVAQGFEVNDVRTGHEALVQLREDPPDVILLDLKMPGIGAIDACREIRESSDVPVIVVSGGTTAKDRVEAFEAGADQYVSRPCGIEELVARIHVVKRRADLFRPFVLVLGEVEIDFETHEAKRRNGVVHLTATEFRLLRCLAAHQGEVLSHRRILQLVWGPDYGDEVAYLRVFVSQLRKKIEPDPARPAYLLTDPGFGYRLLVPPQG